jgi:hypothetical protein
MAVEEVRVDEYVHANLIADAGYPLLSKRSRLRQSCRLAPIIARDPVTGRVNRVRSQHSTFILVNVEC